MIRGSLTTSSTRRKSVGIALFLVSNSGVIGERETDITTVLTGSLDLTFSPRFRCSISLGSRCTRTHLAVSCFSCCAALRVPISPTLCTACMYSALKRLVFRSLDPTTRAQRLADSFHTYDWDSEIEWLGGNSEN